MSRKSLIISIINTSKIERISSVSRISRTYIIFFPLPFSLSVLDFIFAKVFPHTSFSLKVLWISSFYTSITLFFGKYQVCDAKSDIVMKNTSAAGRSWRLKGPWGIVSSVGWSWLQWGGCLHNVEGRSGSLKGP